VNHSAIILLAEDGEDDIFIIQRAFKAAGLSNPFHVVTDGEEAINYLKGEGKFSNREEYPFPDLLFLDLQMPRVDGFEVLKWIRQQAGMDRLRIIVLTSSERTAEVNLAYQLGANSFLVKPLEFERFVEMGKELIRYWLTLQAPKPDTKPSEG
jgi:CheY-like chemotaxis protein